MEAQADQSETVRAALAATDPHEQLRHIVDLNVRLFEHAIDILEIVAAASSTERDVAAFAREGDDRRRQGQFGFVHEWARLNALKPGLTESEAADILWAMTGSELLLLFIKERGWQTPRYRDWLLATLDALLLRQADPAS